MGPSESVTPVHICAALGDYVGLRKLLDAGFPYLTQDQLGRLPLHYAVQTNLPTVIMLLSIETDQLDLPDFANKKPLMFCQYLHHHTVRHYITKLIESLNNEKTGETLGNEDRSDLHNAIVRDAHWKLPLNFEAYLCTKIRPMYCLNRREYCECSGDCALHEKFSENDDLNEVIASRSNDYIKRPTNTFGQFETPSSNVMAEFIRIADDTSTDNFSTLFFDVWKLKQPELALTLFGSIPPSKILQKRFLKMIVTVVHKTLSWVITDGIFDSIAEVMSDGMHGYAEAYGLTRLQVIGIAPWRHLALQSELHSSDYSGSYRARFPDREKIATIYPQIAPFHTRYLFIDSGGKDDSTCIQDFRARFETWLANLSIEVESFEISHNVPICGILVAGRPEHALGVCQALRNGIPFVVIGDSGGLASILEQCIIESEYLLDRRTGSLGDLIGDAKMAENETRESRMLEVMLQFWTEEEITSESLDSVIRILEYSNLIEFLSYEKDSDGTLDAKIVSSLINPVLFQGQESNVNWKPRLKIALELDRADFVMEKILNDTNWTSKELAPFVKSCLLGDKVHFLRTFEEVGFNMHEFATMKAVEELYSVEAHRNTAGAATLKEFLFHYQSKLPTRITIERVKKTLQKIMGHHFLTYNTQSLKQHNPAHRQTFKDIHDELEAGPRKSRDILVGSGEENCTQYLYLWALITGRFEIAQFLLMSQTDICAGALFAATFLRRLADITRQTSDSDDQRLQATEFELLAVSILDACYFNNKENTMHLLVMERRSYGMLSCMMIASEGDCREFMQHLACQEYLDRVWSHTLQINSSSFQFLFSLFVGMACPPLVPYFAEYDETKYGKMTDQVDAKKKKFTVRFYRRKLADFYLAPCVRHAYQLITMIVLFLLFVINLEVELDYNTSLVRFISYFLIAMAVIQLLEFFRIGFLNWISFPMFISSSYNKLIIVASLSYVIGTTIQIMMYLYVPRSHLLEEASQFLLVLAILFPYTKILRLLSIGKYIGPKLQMIIKMAKHDLLPYTAIISVFWVMYCVIFSALVTRPHSARDVMKAIKSIIYLAELTFYHMFGEFQFSEFLERFENRRCTGVDDSGCSYPVYYIMLPILMGMFTLLTHVLLINFLVAIFTETYERMEEMSEQLWTMQRYRVTEYILSESVLPGPLLVFSFAYQIIMYFLHPEVLSNSQKQRAFRKSFEDDPGRERQLINWEKLSALIAMGMREAEQGFKSSSERDSTHPKRRNERLTRTSDRSWQTGHKLTNPALVLEDFSTPNETVDGLEKKISSIDAKLEKITNILSDKGGTFLARAPLSPSRKVSLLPSRAESNVSSLVTKENEDGPIVLQWLNHQIAIFTSMASEVTPYSIRPPIPWEVPYPKYNPISWTPRKSLIVHWITGDESPTGGKPRRTSFNSSIGSTGEKSPKNPEGRVGTKGKGLLPEVGENAACILVVTRGENDEEILVLKGVHHHAQFPWFLCYHPQSCSQTTCYRGLIRLFCQSSTLSETVHKVVVDDFVAYYVKYAKIGVISDPINCDNAWVSFTAIHIQIPMEYRLFEEIEE
nr:transient receptor potential cation channel [Hymenolepis microstoma]